MARKLKTYQTSLGFFDQAIAAPSMKAALEAWGADSNLFHQGAAKESDDLDVVAATMAKPGVVLRRPVGSNGCFGEALDVAFRLLDAARGKRALRETADPLVLVISGEIHNSLVRHGYDGIDDQSFHQLVRVHVAGRRYPGWVRAPEHVTPHRVTQMASYRRPA